MSAYGFDHLLAPISFAEFLESFYEKQPLLIEGRAAKYYRDIISIEQISEHLAQGHVAHPGIRLVKHGDEVDPKEFTYSVTTSTGTTDGIANKEKVFVRFYDGYTIILNSFERHSASVLHLRHITERAFTANAHANIYITPRGSQGFKPHWDNHDVFILQFEGAKEWTIYDSPVLLPSKRRQFREGEWTPVAPSLRTVLAPGDLLYVPRGFVHEAASSGDVSGHITLGITTYTRADVALRLLDRLDADPWFRQSLPADFKNGLDAEQFSKELLRFVEAGDPLRAAAELYAEFASTRMADTADRLLDYIRLERMNPATLLQRKTSVYYDVERDEHAVVLRFNNKAIRLPIVAATAVDAILHASAFRVEDLPDEIDSESKLLLCKKLVEEGFLSIRE